MPTTYVDFGLSLAVGTQSGLGTVNATIKALTGALALADGIVYGDPEGGTGETGFTLTLTREERDASDVAGSFTRQPGTFLQAAGTVTITTPLRGAGNDPGGSITDADFDLSITYPGLHALLLGSGLTAADWAGGSPNDGRDYTPATATPLTIKVWEGAAALATGNAWVLMDCIVESLEIDFTPGDVPIATFNVTIGSVESSAANVTVPTFDFGTVVSVGSPVVKAVGNAWGPADARGFAELTVTLSAETEETPDSNATNGKTVRQTGRSIEFEGVLYAEDSDTDFEWQKLIATSAPTEDMTFTVGTAAAVGPPMVPALAFSIELRNPVVTEFEPDKAGPSLARKVSAYCTAPTTNGEFLLRFK